MWECGFFTLPQALGGAHDTRDPIAIKASGVSCVIAKTFARIFYRNAINNGMLLIECDTDRIADGDELVVDVAGRVIHKKNDPDFAMEFRLSDKQDARPRETRRFPRKNRLPRQVEGSNSPPQPA